MFTWLINNIGCVLLDHVSKRTSVRQPHGTQSRHEDETSSLKRYTFIIVQIRASAKREEFIKDS